MTAKLMTKELASKLPRLYSQENVKDPLIVAKWFDPFSNWTWYAYEGEPVDMDGDSRTDDFEFFGLVDGHCKELGYFTLSQLDSVKIRGYNRIERDLYFRPCRLSTVYPEFFPD